MIVHIKYNPIPMKAKAFRKKKKSFPAFPLLPLKNKQKNPRHTLQYCEICETEESAISSVNNSIAAHFQSWEMENMQFTLKKKNKENGVSLEHQS